MAARRPLVFGQEPRNPVIGLGFSGDETHRHTGFWQATSGKLSREKPRKVHFVAAPSARAQALSWLDSRKGAIS